MKPVDAQEFLARLEQAGVIDAAQADQVRDLLQERPELLVSEAVRDVIGLDLAGFMPLLAAEFGTEYLPAEQLAALEPTPDALELIDSARAQTLAVFPLSYEADRGRLLVAMAYPFNAHVLGELETELGVPEVQVVFCDEDQLAELHHRYYIGEEDLFAAPDGEEGFDIGALSDEEAFPGIYGDAVANYLYDEPVADDGGAATEEDSGVRGSLSDLGLVDMLQALGQSRKTCALFVSRGDWYGNMYLEEGFVIHAETPERQGEEAVYEILQQQEGHFELIKRTWSGEKEMLQNVEALLLEGMRRFDEANR
ncbi:MAG: DUF4388 domain-containing protein [Candidatus Dadabacteria bacterium]|nr:MAG: DUF4388 domain-containing protein [Candidatus Dadabacteria bacterium]